jgi:hypothetical protein
MTLRITLATAARVLRQLRRDPRTIALVLVVPPMILTLFHFVFAGEPRAFDRIGPPLVGIFPMISMFLVTSIAMLRERTSGNARAPDVDADRKTRPVDRVRGCLRPSGGIPGPGCLRRRLS